MFVNVEKNGDGLDLEFKITRDRFFWVDLESIGKFLEKETERIVSLIGTHFEGKKFDFKVERVQFLTEKDEFVYLFHAGLPVALENFTRLTFVSKINLNDFIVKSEYFEWILVD